MSPESPAPSAASGSLFERLRKGLAKTGTVLSSGIGDLVMGKKEIDKNLLEELESRLLMADLGVEVVQTVMGELTEQMARSELGDSQALHRALKKILAAQLVAIEKPLCIDRTRNPFVILVVGVNGVGKTTTIGKLAKYFQQQQLQVMLAAGDTFRAAAVEQLQAWGARNAVPVVAQHTGADSASVIFDAIQSAKAKGVNVLLADTAGRLHTKDNLMEELRKVVRVIRKLDETAPHEILLVLDAGTGQNALAQAEQFRQAVSVTGMVLTKLDGTAKGGILFALGRKFGIPMRFIGVGEGADDLQPFNAEAYVAALLPDSAGVPL